ncbi:hypothetical protein SPI_04622 [Niveomyces insectorum RCEF 264]|uniref:Methyltransferase n=1 Tax=Niveomyces insectorum RCEF 264 TaxID=1081102 RepID=A0A167UP51_9HYPO|nr:hypothetical protein SPI_04622 [Niveomyces insectorum RCEF 264]
MSATTTTTTTTTATTAAEAPVPRPRPGSRDVVTSLFYYDDPGDGTPPAKVVVGKDTVTNERKMEEVPATVEDIAGREASFDLDNCGFQLVHRPSAAVACQRDGFHDEDLIRRAYYGDCERVLAEATGAARVFIFEHKVRRGLPNWHTLGPGNASKRGPLFRAHVDQSYSGARFLVRWFFPDEAEALLQRRWQIVNLWRPINTVFKDPLAVADARSVPDTDLVEAAIVYRDHERRSWTITAAKPPQQHKWYYKHAQTPDEALLIKCYDSVADGSVARRAPHSAFRDPAYDDAEPRESIEVRALLFF